MWPVTDKIKQQGQGTHLADDPLVRCQNAGEPPYHSTMRCRVQNLVCAVVGAVILVMVLPYLNLYEHRAAKVCCSTSGSTQESQEENAFLYTMSIFNRTYKRLEQVNASLPTIYVITPTYKRLEQMAELTRLAQTLMHVPNIHWIVGDDSKKANVHVTNYLRQTGIPFTYLLTPMPQKYKKKGKALPKGVANRNAGLLWVRKHAKEGVVYFADDDNTYDVRLFEEIRRTRRVSAFPVGLVTALGLSTPVLKNGAFYAWYDGWSGNRKFMMDMAGFAFSVQYLLQKPKASMPYKAGYEEDGFLRSLEIEPKELEFLADGCSKIYVWHTKTRPNKPSKKTILDRKYEGTNLRHLQKQMILEEK